MGRVLIAFLQQILGLKDRFRVGARIPIQTMNVKSTFRQVGMDPDSASRCAYGVRLFLFVHFLLQFGWRGGQGDGGDGGW